MDERSLSVQREHPRIFGIQSPPCLGLAWIFRVSSVGLGRIVFGSSGGISEE